MFTEDHLRALSGEERDDLVRDLLRLGARLPTPTGNATARHRFFLITAGACLVLVPWTVLLAATLPRQYTASHWTLTWVGFDVTLAGSLAVTAWLAYRRRQAVAVAALVTGTLLVCDAWFDLTTASHGGDFALSTASALFAELPLAVLLFLAARHILHVTTRRARAAAGQPAGPVRLSRVPLFAAERH